MGDSDTPATPAQSRDPAKNAAAEPGPILAVDPGSKRIGLALSDPGQILASPFRTLLRAGEDPASAIAAVAKETGAVAVVLGLPLRLDGSMGPEAKRVKLLASKLEPVAGVPVVLWDERFTSQEADQRLRMTHKNPKKRKSVRDEAAAAILLQSYLDRAGRA